MSDSRQTHPVGPAVTEHGGTPTYQTRGVSCLVDGGCS